MVMLCWWLKCTLITIFTSVHCNYSFLLNSSKPLHHITPEQQESSMYVSNLNRTFLTLVPVVLGRETQKLNTMQIITTLPHLKTPDSSVQSALKPLLPSKFPLINERSFLYFQCNSPHLILPCSLCKIFITQDNWQRRRCLMFWLPPIPWCTRTSSSLIIDGCAMKLQTTLLC